MSGPFVESSTQPFADVYKARYRQVPPYDHPLPYIYRYTFGRQTNRLTGTQSKSANWSLQTAMSATEKAAIYNEAYAKLVDKLGDSAGWAENIAQAGSARAMFNNRAVQICRGMLALKQCRFKEVARIIRSPVPSRVSNKKSLSQNILEWEYGWKPLLSDLDSSVKIILSDPSPTTIKGRKRRPWQFHQISRSEDSTYRNVRDNTQDGWYAVELGCGVRISNPNTFLAKQYGLIDIALPWKLLPFSFVVDWFVNVEQTMSSCTDWFGVTRTDSYNTVLAKGNRVETFTSYNKQLQRFSQSTILEQDSVYCERALGFSGPTLIVRPFRGFSLERGIQAIALTIAVLGK